MLPTGVRSGNGSRCAAQVAAALLKAAMIAASDGGRRSNQFKPETNQRLARLVSRAFAGIFERDGVGRYRERSAAPARPPAKTHSDSSGQRSLCGALRLHSA